MKKIWISAVILLLSVGTGWAQSDKDYAPTKGSVTLGATVGYNSYTGMNAPVQMQSDYAVTALSTDWFDSKLMVGIEGNWFVTDQWALRFGGGLGYTYRPGYKAVPGTIDAGTTDLDPADVPNYAAIGNSSTFRYTVYAGMNRYWRLKNVPNLLYYTGFQLGFSYGQNQVKYDDEQSMGKSASEVSNLRAAWSCGADYYLKPALYVGVEVHPFAYTYNITGIRPQPGMKMLKADSHNFAFMAAPTLKFGFKF